MVGDGARALPTQRTKSLESYGETCLPSFVIAAGEQFSQRRTGIQSEQESEGKCRGKVEDLRNYADRLSREVCLEAMQRYFLNMASYRK